MKIKVLTLFPAMFDSLLSASLIGKAIEKGALTVELVNIRDYAPDKHKQVDDYPFGGGAGMVMKADVLLRCIEAAKADVSEPPVIYMGPQGKPFSQRMAWDLSRLDSLVLLCGHYEGIDQRVMSRVDDTVSIGDYVLTGGELPAMVLIDAVARLVPGIIGSEDSVQDESFSDGLLEYPQYTRPRSVDGLEVPEVLLSGNHEEIRRWRKKESLMNTLLLRPDLLLEREYDAEEKKMLIEILFPGGTGKEGRK